MAKTVQDLLRRMRELPPQIGQLRDGVRDLARGGDARLAGEMHRRAERMAAQYQHDSVQLMRQLQHLEDGETIMLYRFYVLRQSNAEIAARLHVDLSVVKRRKRMAIKHLEEVWTDE